MKLNLDKVILDTDFKPVLEGAPPRPGEDPDKERPFLMLRAAIRRALLSDARDTSNERDKEKPLPEDERFSRFKLAMKIDEAKIGEEFDLTEVNLIREVCKFAYGTLVYGQVRMMLEEATASGQPADDDRSDKLAALRDAKSRSNGKAAKEAVA